MRADSVQVAFVEREAGMAITAAAVRVVITPCRDMMNNEPRELRAPSVAGQ